MMNELLPCPFCGGKGNIDKTIVGIEEYFIWCRGCNLEMALHKTVKQAIKAWNTRQEVTKQKDAEIRGLKTIIENLEMANASFVDANVDIVEQERERVVEMLKVEQNMWDRTENETQYSAANVHYSLKHLIDRIEKEE